MKTNHYLFKIQCIKLLSVHNVKFQLRVSFDKTSTENENMSLFYSIMDLCRTDSFLTAHVWNNMFTGFWKIFITEEQTNLCNDLEMLFMEKIATEKDLEVFVNAAVKCVPHLYNIYVQNEHFNKEHSFGSFATQLHYAMSLENCIFSAEEKSNNIKILKEIYCNLKESDSIYSLYQSQNVIKSKCIFEAVSYQLNGNNAFKTADLYFEASKEKDNLDAYEFIKAQLHRCVMELKTWKESPIEPNKQIQFEKDLTLLEGAASSGIPLMSCSSTSEEEIVKKKYLECIERCNGFPGRILSNNDYYVLQSLHKLTEHLEVWTLKKSENVERHAKNLNTCHSLWKSAKYLLSDDQNVLAEVFDVRRSAYENFIEKYCENKLHINEVTRQRNEALVKFSSTAINIGKLPITLSNNFVLKSYDSIKDNFSWLLLQVMKSDHSIIREHQPQNLYYLKTIESISDILNKKCHLNEKFKKREILSLSGYMEEIQNELIYKRVLDLGDMTAEWKQLIEHLEMSCLKRDDESYTVQYLACLLETCKSGNTPLYMKFITKILWSLQSVHEMPSIIKFLKDHHSYIPLHYWLPFLSLLFLHTVQTKVVTVEIEQQFQESTNLLFYILIQLAHKYPQETFFAIWNFESSFVFETQELIEKKMVLNTCNKLFDIMESHHPRLIPSLKEMMSDLQSLKSDIQEYHYHWFMLIMEKTYHSLFLILKSENIDSEAETVKNCKNSIIECLQTQFQYDPKTEQTEVSHFIDELEGKQTLAEVLSLLTSTLQKYFQELKNKYVLLPDKCKFLSSYHTLCQNIKMLPKCHTFENSISPPVEIAKFEPIINVCQWINCFAYKIDVRGNDGKVYSYLLMENDRPEETQKSDQLMQFLGIVNTFLAESGNLSQNFLKFRLPSIFSVSPQSKLVPFFDSPIPYLDVFKKETVFFPNFDIHLVQDYFKSKTNIQDSLIVIENIKELFTKKSVTENTFTHWANDVYSPIEKFYFKKQFLRDFSMQYSAELLNLSSHKETMIHRETGKMSPLYLEFKSKNLIENIPAAESVSILTRNLKKFFGLQGLKDIANNVYRVSSVLRENQRYLIPQLLMFSTNYGSEIYTKEEMEICEKQMTAFITESIGMDLSKIHCYLERCTSSTKFCDLFSLYP